VSVWLAPTVVTLTAMIAPVVVRGQTASKPPETDTAAVPVPLPAPRHGHRIERLDGGLLCFGGFGDPSAPDRESKQTWWLAPGSREWRRRADMSVGRTFFGSAVAAGMVFAVGDGVERYDPKLDRWTKALATNRIPRTHFAAAAVGSTIYVLGGVGGADKMLAVDVRTGVINEMPSPPGFKRGDHFHCMQSVRGRLRVVGGIGGDAQTLQAEHWMLDDPRADSASLVWRSEIPPPARTWAKFAVQAVDGDNLYLFGDFGAFRFDAMKKKWTRRAPLPFELVMPQAVVLDGGIWVIGGQPVDEHRRHRRVLLRYDLAKDQWTDQSEE
jgi:hypothetical protein